MKINILLFCCINSFVLKGQSYTIQKVYQNLVAAYGDARPAPDLVLITKKEKQGAIAQYIPGVKPAIKIDETLWEICKGFKKDSLNALASVLSHELAHYYQNHNWCADYAFALQGETIGEKLKFLSKEEKIRSEAQADQVGAFHAAMSGYETTAIFPLLLDAIYSTYNLPDEVAGYPTKAERKKFASHTATEVAQLFNIFEASKYSFLLQKYDISALCLEQIAKKFPSREILHNLGTAYLMQALKEMPQGQMPFLLPIEIETNTRLSATQRGDINDDNWLQNLKKAKHFLEEALRKDQSFALAYQNLACVYLLENNPYLAIGKIKELKDNLKTLSPEALEIKAIAHYFAGQNEAAKSGIKSLENNNTLAWLLTLSETYNVEKYAMEYADFCLKNEKKPNLSSNNWKETLPVMPSQCKIANFEDSQQVAENPLIEVMIQRDSFQRCIISTPLKDYKLVQTRSDFKGKTSKGLMLDATITQVIDSYGKPDFKIQSAQYQYFIYENGRIIFELEKEGRLKSWILYEEVKK
jgi:hypothetical protein